MAAAAHFSHIRSHNGAVPAGLPSKRLENAIKNFAFLLLWGAKVYRAIKATSNHRVY
jgi:hypothetical protein